MIEPRRRLTNSDIPAAALAAHTALVARIRARMAQQQGRLSYAEYVEMALFELGVGYYDSGQVQFGDRGDFVTAPEISPLFSRCLAHHAIAVIQNLGGGSVLEFGAGAGTMACDILLEMERQACLPNNYFIVERSTKLRIRQQTNIAERAPHLLSRVAWHDEASADFSGAIFANELLDAFPVHRIRLHRDAPAQEFFVVWNAQNECFAWELRDIAHPTVRTLATRIHLDWENCAHAYYDTEVHVAAYTWLAGLATRLTRGAVILIDYGYPRHEYYLPERDEGTIVCYFQHTAHADPLILTGVQDLTAHVEFSSLAEAADEHGLNVAGFTTQGHFLLDSGLEDMVGDVIKSSARDFLPVIQQIKRLVMPTGMGEMFKVLALTKNYTGPLPGFRSNNRLDRL